MVMRWLRPLVDKWRSSLGFAVDAVPLYILCSQLGGVSLNEQNR